MQDAFERLMERFGVEDATIWVANLGWCRARSYDDGAWLVGRKIEPINFWGA